MGNQCVSAKQSHAQQMRKKHSNQNEFADQDFKSKNQSKIEIQLKASSCLSQELNEDLRRTAASSLACSPSKLSPHSEIIAATPRSEMLESVLEQSETRQQRKTNRTKSKMNYFEIFLIQRKHFMQTMGIFKYDAYTVLPPPKLRSIQNNPLFLKRKANNSTTTTTTGRRAAPLLSIERRPMEQNRPNLIAVDLAQAPFPAGDCDATQEIYI